MYAYPSALLTLCSFKDKLAAAFPVTLFVDNVAQYINDEKSIWQ